MAKYKSALLAGLASTDRSVLREPYKNWAKLAPATAENTSYRNYGDTQMLNAYIVRALDAFAGGGGDERLDLSAVMIADGSADNGQVSYATQWKKFILDPNKQKQYIETVLVHATSNGFLFGATIDLSGNYHPFPQFGSSTDDFDLTSLMLALILIEADKAKHEERNGNHISWELLQSAKDDVGNQGYVSENTVRIVCDEIQCGLTDPDETKRIKFSMIKNTVNLLTKDRIDSNEFASGKIVCGDPDILKPLEFRATIRNTKGITIREMMEIPKIAAFRKSHNWNAEQRKMIPNWPLDMIVPPEIVKDILRYIESLETATPFVNFEWKGKTGYGKSTGVEIMAQILDLPLTRITCSSNTDIEKFLYQYVPDGKGNCAIEELPTYEDIMLDPDAAYQRLTGELIEGVAYQTVLEAYGKAFAQAYNKTPGYTLVESDYVQALRCGYIVEIQEPSRIRDSGVLPGLNNFDKPGAIIPRPDGSKCVRSPYAIVYMTDNVGYAGCRPMDASVIRRMCTVHTSYVVDKAMAMDRLKTNVPGLTDIQRKRLYNIWEGIVRFCKDNEITEGDISIVELELWGAVVSWEGEADLLESCIDCVISKATNDPDTQEELIEFVKLKLSDQY